MPADVALAGEGLDAAAADTAHASLATVSLGRSCISELCQATRSRHKGLLMASWTEEASKLQQLAPPAQAAVPRLAAGLAP